MDSTRDTDEPKASTGVLAWMGVALLLLALYILSPGPLRLLVEKGFVDRNSYFAKVIGILLMPLEWAYRHNDIIRVLYDAYFSLFGL